MKYIVSYIIDRFLQDENSRDYYRPEGHTMIVQRDDKVQAFIAAYQLLVAQGQMVCTVGSKTREIGDDGPADWSLAGLSSDEMEKVYNSGVPKVSPGYNRIAMTHIEEIGEFAIANNLAPYQTDTATSETITPFIDADRLAQLKSISSSRFDLTRLIRLCEETNFCYGNGCYLAVAMLARAILDHIPPIFGFNTFSEIVSNYAGTRSFKGQMEHLQNSLRKIADAHLHTQIRNKEALPSKTQVNFTNDIDVLLSEIIRITK